MTHLRASLLSLLPIGFMIAMLQSSKMMLAGKYVLDNYAGGFSAAKTMLLLLFLGILLVLRPFPSPWKKKWNPVFWVGLGSLYAIALAEYVYYCQLFGLPLNQRSVLVYDGLQSSTRLDHLHTSKGIVAQLLPYSGQVYDGGRPYLAVFPSAWLWVHAILFLAFCFVTVCFVHHYQKELTPARGLLLALGLYPIIKAVVDGGPFSIPDIGRAALLALVFLNPKARNRVMIFLGLLLTLCFILQFSKGPLVLLLRFLLAIVTLSLPLLWEKARQTGGARWIGFGLGALVLLSAPVVTYKYFPIYRSPYGLWQYGDSVLEKDWNVTLVSDKSISTSPFGEITQVREGQRRLSVSMVKLSRDCSVFEICDQHRLNILRTPVSWYPQPAFVLVEGRFTIEHPSEWLTSNLVLSYAYEKKGDWTRLALELVPGGDSNCAVDLLPDGPLATRRVDLVYEKPEMKVGWEKGPGSP